MGLGRGLSVSGGMGSLPRSHPSHFPPCLPQNHQTTPLRLAPGAAFSAPASWGLLQTPPPSPGATGNSLLQQILGEARLWEAADMPLLGSCHIPQAQGDQLDPPMQASSTPGDVLRSSYLLLQSLNLPWDHPWLQLPPTPRPLAAPSKQ